MKEIDLAMDHLVTARALIERAGHKYRNMSDEDLMLEGYGPSAHNRATMLRVSGEMCDRAFDSAGEALDFLDECIEIRNPKAGIF